MELLHKLIDVALHLKDYMDKWIPMFGGWSYVLLFVVIFCETGLVVTPFLPGDSLLFITGTFAAEGVLNFWGTVLVMSVAAVLGDAANYTIGYTLGPRLKQKGGGRFIKQEYLDRTHRFYEKYGKMTIILARFVPIVRTFAPFMAGMGSMRYAEFAAYNVIGGVAWVLIGITAGYWFGNIPLVKKNFELVLVAIVVISVLPMVFEWWRHRKDSAAAAGSGASETD